MNRTNRPNNESHDLGGRNLPLSMVASLLILAGVVGVFAPALLESLLPAETARELLPLAPLLLVAGIGLEGYLIYQLVRRARARATQARRMVATQAAPVAGSTFGDSAASSVEWSPARAGGANFKTMRLIERGHGRMEFRATWQIFAFSALFIVIGVGVSGAMVFAERHDPFSFDAIFPILIGLLFAGVGVGILYFSSRPAVFDRQVGWYWRGNPALRSAGEIRALRQATELANIRALQLITEHVSGKSSFHSYELNLVLKNGTRINVVDHGNQAALAADAQTLARFLGVPVWTPPTN